MSAKRPSARSIQPASPALVVTPQNVQEFARASCDGDLNASEVQEVERQLDANPALREAFERRKKVLAMMAASVGNLSVSPDFEQKASKRLADRSQIKSNRLTQGLDSSAQALSAITLGGDGEQEDEALTGAPAGGLLGGLTERLGAAPWWIISGSFHALLLLLLTLIGMAVIRDNAKEVVIVSSLEKRIPPEEPKQERERDIFTKPIPIETTEPVTTETPVVTHEEVEIAEHNETANEMDSHDAKGTEGLTDVDLGGTGTSAALGIGGGGGGAFGRPSGGGARLRRAIAGGGGKATESAVDKALEWLARHQEADGRWSVRNTEGRGAGGSIDWDPGVTGLAVLAFLGAGHTEKVGKYKEVVRKAVAWIIKEQNADGAIGSNPKWTEHHGGFGYHHAICGMALAEASAMGRVPETKAAAQKAIDYTCHKYQFGDGSDKLGWRYSPKAAVGDLSVSGWYVMQLKSAKIAGLHVDPASFDGAIKFLDSREQDAAKVKKEDDGYDTGRHRYGYTEKGAMVNTTSIGILCRLYLGAKPEEVHGSALWLLKTNPPAWKADLGVANGGGWPMYYMYYTTLTMFQTGGDVWKEWNTALKQTLLTNQRKDGDADGSWDPLSEWEKNAGRAYTTALGAMCLEVYYRYMPLYRDK